MSKDSLEHIIRQKFDGASSQVPTGAWSGLESQLGGAVSSAAGVGSVSLLTKIIIGAGIAASVIIAGVLINNSSSTDEVNLKAPSEKPVEKELTTLIPSIIEDEILEEKTVSVATPNSEKSISSNGNKNQISQKEEKLIKTPPKEVLVQEQTDPTDNSVEIQESTEQGANNSVQQETTTTIKVEKEEETPLLVPSKIIASEVSDEPLTLELKLNQLDARSEVQWYINDEFVHSGIELRHEQTFDADLTIMALITTEGEEPHSVFKDLKIELPMVLSIPNIFSPNGDLMNPVFKVDQEKSRNVASYTLLVRNKQGELIFESTTNKPDWNGDLPNGNPAPVGTYFYIIQAQSALGQTKTEKGTLQLKR